VLGTIEGEKWRESGGERGHQGAEAYLDPRVGHDRIRIHQVFDSNMDGRERREERGVGAESTYLCVAGLRLWEASCWVSSNIAARMPATLVSCL